MSHEFAVRNLKYTWSKQVPVRRLASLRSPPPKKNKQGKDIGWREDAELQNQAWNKLQYISWAIAYNLEVSR